MRSYEQWTYITRIDDVPVYRHTDGRLKGCDEKALRRYDLIEFFKRKSKEEIMRYIQTPNIVPYFQGGEEKYIYNVPCEMCGAEATKHCEKCMFVYCDACAHNCEDENGQKK